MTFREPDKALPTIYLMVNPHLQNDLPLGMKTDRLLRYLDRAVQVWKGEQGFLPQMRRVVKDRIRVEMSCSQ